MAGRCGLPRLKPAEDVEPDEELLVSPLLCAALLTRSLLEEKGETKTGHRLKTDIKERKWHQRQLIQRRHTLVVSSTLKL